MALPLCGLSRVQNRNLREARLTSDKSHLTTSGQAQCHTRQPRSDAGLPENGPSTESRSEKTPTQSSRTRGGVSAEAKQGVYDAADPETTRRLVDLRPHSPHYPGMDRRRWADVSALCERFGIPTPIEYLRFR